MENQELHQEHVDVSSINAKCCCFAMRKVMRAVTQCYDRYLESTGIRSTQFTLLVELSSTKAKTLTEIAEGLVMDRTTLTRNLKPLEKLELISTIQPVDKRSKAYILTELGKQTVDKCVPLWEKAQNSIVGNLGDERFDGLLRELSSVIEISNNVKVSR